MLSVLNIGVRHEPPKPQTKQQQPQDSYNTKALMAMFASPGLATKNILYPLIGPLIGAIYVPTGSVTGGLYMMCQ